MKINKTLLITICALVVLAFAFTKGVSKSRVGYIHTNALWELMPAKKKADTVLAGKKAELEKFFKLKQAEFQDKYIAYTRDSASLSGAIKEQRLKEVISLNESLQDMPKSFDVELLKSRDELYTPIRKKMQEAVDKVAKGAGFDFIIDTSYGTIIYSGNTEDNILPLVKKELGIK